MDNLAVGRFQVDYVETALDGDRFFLPVYALQRPAVKCFLEGSVWEPDTHKLVHHILARAPGSMLHAGTFFGDMLPSFARAAQTLWCFEPVLENYILARMIAEANGLANVNLFCGALSDRVGTVRMDVTDPWGAHRGGSSFVGSQGVATPAFTVDQFAYDALNILHLDVEDHELFALKGAQRTIETHRPIILIEDRSAEAAAFLAELGYRPVGRIPHLAVWLNDANRQLEAALQA